MNEITITRTGDTYAVQFPQREFVLTRRDDAVTIAQYYADQHGIPVVEDGTTIYTPATRDGFAVLSQREIERNRAQAAE